MKAAKPRPHGSPAAGSTIFAQALQKLGWSASQAASRLHINQAQIWRLCYGKSNMSAQTTLILSLALRSQDCPHPMCALAEILRIDDLDACFSSALGVSDSDTV
jgi:hypothetical protein